MQRCTCSPRPALLCLSVSPSICLSFCASCCCCCCCLCRLSSFISCRLFSRRFFDCIFAWHLNLPATPPPPPPPPCLSLPAVVGVAFLLPFFNYTTLHKKKREEKKKKINKCHNHDILYFLDFYICLQIAIT